MLTLMGALSGNSSINGLCQNFDKISLVGGRGNSDGGLLKALLTFVSVGNEGTS